MVVISKTDTQKLQFDLAFAIGLLYTFQMNTPSDIFSVNGRKILGVAFDLEGTLVNLEKLHWDAHMRASEEAGLDLYLNLEDFNDPKNTETFLLLPHFIGSPREVIMQDIVTLARQQHTLDPNLAKLSDNELVAYFSKIDKDHFENTFANLTEKDCQPRVGAIELIRQLKAKGIPIAIGSLTESISARKILKLSGLDKEFEGYPVILREDVKKLKPDPEVYLATARAMGIDPKNQLVFEDSHTGVQAGVEAGSVVVGIPTVYQEDLVSRLLESRAYMTVREWQYAPFYPRELSSLRNPMERK